jgi:glutamate racemase
MRPLSTAPIGVFDSGVGGLSVLRAIRNALPAEDLIYVADSANAPYGERESGFVEERALAVVQFLVESGVKVVVVACNTATVLAVEKLRARYGLPIMAMEPAIKPALACTSSKVAGVLGTSRALASPSVARLCRHYGQDVKIILQPCPGLVEQVERGEIQGDVTRLLLAKYINHLLDAGADTLVLGCTHYPFLEPEIRMIVGTDMSIIGPSAAVARELMRRLTENHNVRTDANIGVEHFFTTVASSEARITVSP